MVDKRKSIGVMSEPEAIERDAKVEREASPAAYELIAIDKLIPTPDNPRTIRANDPKLKELAASIKTHGVLQPVLARPHPTKKGFYDLRAGERRFRASKIAGLAQIPAVVREMDDKTAAEVTNIENLQREDLTPLEEAKGIAGLVAGGWTLEQVAHQLGKSIGWAARRNALNKLIEPFRKAFDGSSKKLDLTRWSGMHMELIAALPADAQERMYRHSIEHTWNTRDFQNSTVVELRRTIGEWMRVLSSAPWKRDDADLVKAAGACSTCTKRSSCQPELFDSLELVSKSEDDDDDDEPKKKGGRKPEKERGDTCLDTKCWDEKQKAFLLRREEELKDEFGSDLLIVKTSYQDGPVDKSQEKRALNYSQFNKVKKGSEGAQPALSVCGPDAGHLIYIKRYSSSSSQKENGGKKTLAQKKKELDERRRKKAASLVSHELERRMKDGPDRADTVITEMVAIGIVATWGGQSQEKDDFGHYGQESWRIKTVIRLAEDKEAGVLSLYKQGMHRYFRLIQSALGYNVEEACKLAKGACELMEWSWPGFVTKAKEAIKEPKAWASEAAAVKASKTAKKAKGKK